MSPDNLVILFCLILSAFFSGMEIAFVSSNRIVLEMEKQKGGIASRILKVITRNPSRFITTMLVGNNIALVIYGIFMGDKILQLFFPNTLFHGDPTLSIIFYQTLISTGIILITAEFLPKVFFQLYANTLVKLFTLPVAFFYYLFSPISYLIMQLTNTLLRKVFKTNEEDTSFSFSKMELGHYIEEQLELGIDKENIDSEMEIFQNALEFSEVKAREAMVPRAEVVAVALDTSLKKVRALFTATGFSKIPVFKNSIDEIIGYIHAFEMFKNPKNIKTALLPVSYVPESMPVSEVLKILTRQRKSMAVVIDEYGGTSGIMTVEDIVEELFGEIEDEHDTTELIEKQIEKTVFEFSARLEVDYLNKKYNLDLPETEFYETLGGMIVYQIGEIPGKNEVVMINNYRLKVKKVSSTKIERVILEKTEMKT